METSEKKVKSYKDTLNLPTTSLSIRANMAEREPQLRKWWTEERVETEFFIEGQNPFVLHDGPPYANGHLHVGHALNKVLKDIIIRSQRMSGRAVEFAPGWDCHGLPIELKVVAESGNVKESDPVAFKKLCREYVMRWQAIQEEEFKELGVFAQWNERYLTMDPIYQAGILYSLGTFADKGYIERKGKTVPWCFSCRTVLATAEIEHAERKDPSCYILFPLDSHTIKLADNRQLLFLVWTTTPWTIPLNRAVVLNPDAAYAIVAIDEKRAVIVGNDLVQSLLPILGEQAVILGTVASSELVGLRAQHPLIDNFTVPVIADEAVLTTDGTACLHSAPGCGPEDYLMGVKNNLEIYSPLSADGRYTDAIKPQELNGMLITDGQWWVLKQLQERGTLLHKTSIKHSYPHCWRCRNGLMFRATDQWFCNLGKNNLIERAQAALNEIDFVPSWGKIRLNSFLSHRTEWCISRQRSWGVPIPALFHTITGTSFLSGAFIRAIAEKVAIHGIEYWDKVTIAQLRHEGLIPEGLRLIPEEHIRKETDILDVWFDSGVSHTAVIAQRRGKLPVDLYVEGSDQHRGWFQSSLLCSLIIHGKPQTKAIVTHGFVVDAHGHKMSKSRGNVVDPKAVVQKYGADVLRLWVASVDYERDVAISDTLLTQTAEVYRKIRNTCRFLLANLYDFNPETDCLPVESLLLIDRYAIYQALTVQKEVRDAYANYSFATVVQLLARYCSVELSAHYLDMSKDRLYVELPHGNERRSAQTTQHYILMMLNQMMAPIMPFTAEDVFLSMPYSVKEKSIHLQRFLEMSVPLCGSSSLWKLLHELRNKVLQQIEILRAQSVIKHSLEAAITLNKLTASEYDALYTELITLLGSNNAIELFLKEWFIVSQCQITNQDHLPLLHVAQAQGLKCLRCWHWFQLNADHLPSQDHSDLCPRCRKILEFF
jgi:isoleucyl-tRNA synthetase